MIIVILYSQEQLKPLEQKEWKRVFKKPACKKVSQDTMHDACAVRLLTKQLGD